MIMRAHPFNHLHGAIICITFFITGDNQANRSMCVIFNKLAYRSNKGSNTPFHIGRSTTK